VHSQTERLDAPGRLAAWPSLGDRRGQDAVFNPEISSFKGINEPSLALVITKAFHDHEDFVAV
jgi:hypothetical protein